MSLSINILVLFVIIIGILLKYFIFYNETKQKNIKSFITSKMMLEFLVEIIAIFLGLFISMGITQRESEQKERKLAVTILNQACEFALEQYDDIHAYLINYEPEDHNNSSMLDYNTALDMEYYDNIVSNDIIIRHLNTHTYGIFNKYLKYIEVLNSQIESIDFKDTKLKHEMLIVRERHFARLITILDVCALEVSGELTSDEYNEMMKQFDYLINEQHEILSEFDKGSDCLVENIFQLDIE